LVPTNNKIKTMEEDVVLFDTAKLAKEKGFESVIGLGHVKPRGQYYNSDGVLNGCVLKELKSKLNKDNTFVSIAAPTQSLLKKWLREKHNIIVSADALKYEDGNLKWGYFISIINNNGYFITGCEHKEIEDPKMIPYFSSYEKAIEAGLKESLSFVNV